MKRAENNFGKIGVLMGGPSEERDISLKSGKAVLAALSEAGFQAEEVEITSDNRRENIDLINQRKIDCAFVALHGRFGEDGQIQEILEELALAYTGSGVLASRLAMDKIASRKIFQQNGLNAPRFKIVEKHRYNGRIVLDEDFGFPLVVKPAQNGSSIGLSIVDDEGHLEPAITKAFDFDQRILIEEYVGGREVTVGILKEEPLPVIEVVPKKRFFDFQAKYQPGLTEYIVPAQLPPEVAKRTQASAALAHKLLGCFGCSRVDIILQRGISPFVLEVNTIPGFTSTSLLPKAASAQGINFPQLCTQLIALAYEKTKTKLPRRLPAQKAEALL